MERGARQGQEPGGVTPNPEFWRDRRVLVTGHNGFKGSWLCLWLQLLGARVYGASLPEPPTSPSLYRLVGVQEGMRESYDCDVRDGRALERALAGSRPEVVIHMAAQPLVRASFAAPGETFAVNALGTATLLDAVRGCEQVRAVVLVTSDKCYAPSADGHPHREGDPLGGDDPYSASKACAELVAHAYRDSFFSDVNGPRIATARAGNVIGGGDFGAERLLPDLFRAVLAGEPLLLRDPDAVRPWQHVLSPLSGYLVLAQALCESPGYARAWNFGPDEQDALAVRDLVERVAERWPGSIDWCGDERGHPRENPVLRLDSTRARTELGWGPMLSLERGIELTVEWFAAYAAAADMRAATLAQIDSAHAVAAGGEGVLGR